MENQLPTTPTLLITHTTASNQKNCVDTYLFDVIHPGENTSPPLHQDGELFREFPLPYRGTGVHSVHLGTTELSTELPANLGGLLGAGYAPYYMQRSNPRRSDLDLPQVVS